MCKYICEGYVAGALRGSNGWEAGDVSGMCTDMQWVCQGYTSVQRVWKERRMDVYGGYVTGFRRGVLLTGASGTVLVNACSADVQHTCNECKGYP